MKLLIWLICKALNKIEQALILLLTECYDEKLKKLLLEYVSIEIDIEEYLKTIKKK